MDEVAKTATPVLFEKLDRCFMTVERIQKRLAPVLRTEGLSEASTPERSNNTELAARVDTLCKQLATLETRIEI